MTKERVNLNTTIRKDLKIKLQIAALKQDKNMNDLLEDLLEEYFNKGDNTDENY
jgi:predicted HicB family RNase H-like nuclease